MRRTILVVGAALLLSVVAILGFGYWRENFARAQDTVASIFGERITTGELLELTRPRAAAFDRRIAAFRAAGLNQQATQFQSQRNQLPETVLNELVEDRIIRREAGLLGLTVTPDEVDARLRRQVAEADLANQPRPTPTVTPEITPTAAPTPAGTPTARPTPTPAPTLTEDRYGAALQSYLAQVGFAEDQIRRLLESELYEEKVRQAIGDQNIPAVQEQVRGRHIVLKTEEEAREVQQQLQGGASFEELAATRSQDQATKDKGGDLGWMPKMGRDPAFDSAVFALEPGQTSDVVRTMDGWEIIQVLEHDPARPVEPTLLDEMRRQSFGDWLATKMGDPEIQRDLSPEESAWILQRLGGRPS